MNNRIKKFFYFSILSSYLVGAGIKIEAEEIKQKQSKIIALENNLQLKIASYDSKSVIQLSQSARDIDAFRKVAKALKEVREAEDEVIRTINGWFDLNYDPFQFPMIIIARNVFSVEENKINLLGIPSDSIQKGRLFKIQDEIPREFFERRKEGNIIVNTAKYISYKLEEFVGFFDLFCKFDKDIKDNIKVKNWVALDQIVRQIAQKLSVTVEFIKPLFDEFNSLIPIKETPKKNRRWITYRYNILLNNSRSKRFKFLIQRLQKVDERLALFLDRKPIYKKLDPSAGQEAFGDESGTGSSGAASSSGR